MIDENVKGGEMEGAECVIFCSLFVIFFIHSCNCPQCTSLTRLCSFSYPIVHFSHVPLLGLEAIRRNGELVGFLRQGEYGFHIKKSIGYGYVKHPEGSKVTNKFLEEGEYTVERMGEVYQAQVHIKSPFDPGNKRVQGIYEEGLELNRERAN